MVMIANTTRKSTNNLLSLSRAKHIARFTSILHHNFIYSPQHPLHAAYATNYFDLFERSSAPTRHRRVDMNNNRKNNTIDGKGTTSPLFSILESTAVNAMKDNSNGEKANPETTTLTKRPQSSNNNDNTNKSGKNNNTNQSKSPIDDIRNIKPPKFTTSLATRQKHTPQPTVVATKSVFKHIPLDLWSLDNMIIPIDKPLGITSYDVVRRMKWYLNQKKVGHCGTLDPNASGLILIGACGATKRLNEFLGSDKVYEFTVRFGESTESLDSATPVIQSDPDNITKCSQLSIEKIKQVAAEKFTGVVSQKSPLYSAIRVGGKKLYKIAYMTNKDEKEKILAATPLPIREVTIHKLDILDKLPSDDPRDFSMVVHCSKGTYVRVIADDLARACGFVGGHVVKLRRVSIAEASVDHAWTLEEFEQFSGRIRTPRNSAERKEAENRTEEEMSVTQ